MFKLSLVGEADQVRTLKLIAIILAACVGSISPIFYKIPGSNAQEEVGKDEVFRPVRVVVDSVTVRIDPMLEGRDGVSGVIINRQGDEYTVITAAHVVKTQDIENGVQYSVKTEKNETFNVSADKIIRFPGLDLAGIKFTSTKNYPTVRLGIVGDLNRSSTLQVGGWIVPVQTSHVREYASLPGYFLRHLSSSEYEEHGYDFLYSLGPVQEGLSGGPVLNFQGELVGITLQAVRDIYTDLPDPVGGISVDSFLEAAIDLGLMPESEKQRLLFREEYINRNPGRGNIEPTNAYFTFVGSPRTMDAALQQINEISQNHPDLTAVVFPRYRGSAHYGVAMSSFTSRENAEYVRSVAISRGIADDAFLWSCPDVTQGTC